MAVFNSQYPPPKRELGWLPEVTGLVAGRWGRFQALLPWGLLGKPSFPQAAGGPRGQGHTHPPFPAPALPPLCMLLQMEGGKDTR